MGATKQKKPAFHIVSLLLVASASAAGGFALVVSIAGAPSNATDHRDGGGSSALALDARVPEKGQHADAGPVSSDARGSRDAEAGALDRAAPAPNVFLQDPFYFRCWPEGTEEPLQNEDCGRLRGLERLVASRLSVVADCRARGANPLARGTLSLAVDLNFGDDRIRFWSGRSSNIEGAEDLAACVRESFGQVDLQGFRPRFQRYTVFFPIILGERPEGADAGQPVQVVMDRVRLRTRPRNGNVVARLRQGEPVWVRETRDGWVRVRTADGREGWIFTPAITEGDQ